MPAPARDITRLGRTDGHEVNVSESERWFSVVLGGMLTLFGLQRRSVRGTLLAASGASLIYRGLSGHCHTYAALGVDTSEFDELPPADRDTDGFDDPVDEASAESFPASDPPAWTGGGGAAGSVR